MIWPLIGVTAGYLGGMIAMLVWANRQVERAFDLGVDTGYQRAIETMTPRQGAPIIIRER